MKNHDDFAIGWIDFLDELNRARKNIGCSISNAWFRGQADPKPLWPSIYRYGRNADIDDKSRLEEIKRKIVYKEDQWKEHLKNKKSGKKKIQAFQIKEEEKSAATYNDDYHTSVNSANQAKKELALQKYRLKQFLTPVLGEREIFDEYVHKSGKSIDISSWEILAEMRHHNIQTRLLDWTDQFEIALYFSLEKFRAKINFSSWQENIDPRVIDSLKELPTPCIWLLNPYKLSKKATERYSIWDITREKEYDYYNVLLVERKWPFDIPVPIYAPGKLERIRSQGGYFTVFGNNKEPLENQIGKDCLLKIDISIRAAVFGAKYLTFFKGMSDFTLFRDLDTLGKELNDKFLRMQGNDKDREVC